MDIKELKVNDLVPYENNPRNNNNAIEAVANSIKEFGFKVPVVVDKDNVLVAGHTRVKAAKLLGIETIPCIVADDLTPEQIKAFRLADNKVGELATWDMTKLEQELDQLSELEFDMTGLGFEVKPEAKDDDFNVDAALDEIDVPMTGPGDVWILGEHRVLCGDSTKKKDVEKLMNCKEADITITDPPYNVDYQNVTTDMKIMNDKMDDAKFRSFLQDSFKRMMDSMKKGAPIYVFHADTEGFNFRAAFKEAGFKLSQNLVWVKSSLVPGYSDYQWRHEPILYGWRPGASHRWYGDRTNSTVMEDVKNISPASMKKAELVKYIKDLQEKDYAGSSVIRADKPLFNGEHPTMKPVKLVGKLMTNSSDEGDLVLDPFGGSGSTLIAAEQLGRTCYMMEMDPKYCDVIVKRWENTTGSEAKKA